MKKKCKYCGGIVKVNKDELVSLEPDNIFDDAGKGVYCDLCGSFIEVNIPYRSTCSSYSSSRRRYYARRRSIRTQQLSIAYTITGILFIILLPFLFYVSGGIYPVLQEKTYSTFCLLDQETEYDVSKIVNSSIYAPKEDIEFNSTDDFYNLGNFYLLIDNKITDMIKVDLRGIDIFWISIDPLNVSQYKPDYRILSAVENHNYNIYVINKTR